MSQVHVIIKLGQVLFCHFDSQEEDVKQSQEEPNVLLLPTSAAELGRQQELDPPQASHPLPHGLHVTQVWV